MNITAQALDSVFGRGAAGVRLRLEREVDGIWWHVTTAETDGAGVVKGWDTAQLERGLYRMIFDSDHYFVNLGMTAAYPEIAVMFRIVGDVSSFQIQVTLSPYSYSTYFGSNG
ncbi:hydroxyisourate hydrolase [Microbispora sp. H10670]|uniref:hydroxyisourate hydrolase n=1 Tax=unclassified Microbispora TaxID=2614687 RepID=UPI001600FF12|nr:MULTISPECIES: hydroxyisourate hydrolase [unclassified Microbispora]